MPLSLVIQTAPRMFLKKALTSSICFASRDFSVGRGGRPRIWRHVAQPHSLFGSFSKYALYASTIRTFSGL